MNKLADEKQTIAKPGLITKKQAIDSYRVITGACEAGVRNFVQSVGKIKSHYTLSEVIALTKGQYGHSEYRNFFIKEEA